MTVKPWKPHGLLFQFPEKFVRKARVIVFKPGESFFVQFHADKPRRCPPAAAFQNKCFVFRKQLIRRIFRKKEKIAQPVIRRLRKLLLRGIQCFFQRFAFCACHLQGSRRFGCICRRLRCLNPQRRRDAALGLCKIYCPRHAFFGRFAAKEQQAPPGKKQYQYRAEFH